MGSVVTVRVRNKQVISIILDIHHLWQVKAWHELKQKLRCGGRIMVNCGGTSVERRDPELNDDDGTWTWEDGSTARDTTLSAMAQVFPEVIHQPSSMCILGSIRFLKLDNVSCTLHTYKALDPYINIDFTWI